jgi:hypothetical protein
MSLFQEYPNWVANSVQRAEDLCAGRFQLLDVEVKYDRPVPWHADPVTGKNWPQAPYYAVPIFDGNTGYGDIKHVWELNRHQFLVDVARAYWLTREERYAETCVSLVCEWIQTNPYLIGVNWTSALEIAVRSLSWIWVYFLCLYSKAMEPRRHCEFLKSLYQHGQYLERHLSLYFSPYNHLIGEAAALACLGVLFPEFQCAARWKEKGWKILSQEIDRQFYADGGTVEQAMSYHHFTLGFYLMTALLRQVNAEHVEDHVWRGMEKAFEFSMYMMQPDGTVPMIGDNDDALSILLRDEPSWNFQSFLAIGAVLFGRADFKHQAGQFSETAFWLLGEDGYRRFQDVPMESPSGTSIALEDCGYYIMRTGWDTKSHYLCFDCGPLADGVFCDDTPSAAHGHADTLSLTIATHGQPILVDPGFYTYNGSLDWHRYFRETQAHNTVVVDDQSQAKYRGRLKWSQAPQARLHHWVSSGSLDYVEGTHTGYMSLSQPVEHRRAIAFLKPDYWFIRDQLIGTGEHQIDRYFHFAPVQVVHDPETLAIRSCSAVEGNLTILPVEKENVMVDLMDAGETPDSGWLAQGYGKKSQSPVARFRTVAQVPIALHTLIVPFRTHPLVVTIEPLALNISPQSSVSRAFAIDTGTTVDVVLFSSANQLVTFYETWATDGEVVYVRLDTQGAVQAGALLEGTTLVVDGKVLLKLDRKVHFAAFSYAREEFYIELSETAKVSTSFSHPHVVVSSTCNGVRNI